GCVCIEGEDRLAVGEGDLHRVARTERARWIAEATDDVPCSFGGAAALWVILGDGERCAVRRCRDRQAAAGDRHGAGAAQARVRPFERVRATEWPCVSREHRASSESGTARENATRPPPSLWQRHQRTAEA